MNFQHLICSKNEQIATITLNRPNKKNALSSILRNEIIACLDELEKGGTRAIILTGAGDTFCAGFDLSEFENADMKEIFSDADIYHHRLHICPIPTIAAINGNAYAGGMDLAALCDLRVCSDTASFAQPQVKMGIPAAYDIVKLHFPETIAREICLTGQKITAAQAFQHGFINKIVSKNDLMASAVQLATDVASSTGSGTMKKTFVDAQQALFGIEN